MYAINNENFMYDQLSGWICTMNDQAMSINKHSCLCNSTQPGKMNNTLAALPDEGLKTG